MSLFIDQDFDYSRIAGRKYPEIIEDVLVFKGWKKVDLANAAREWIKKYRMDWKLSDAAVYEWCAGGADAHSSMTKLMEWTLGISLPFQCYYNAGKR